MKYAGIIKNDFTGAPGVQLTVFAQGCPHRCKNCQNPETWDFNGGIDFTEQSMKEILIGLTANGIQRTLGFQGGEPLYPGENVLLTRYIIQEVKNTLPDTKIYIWSGYTYEELKTRIDKEYDLWKSLWLANFLIDGPYIEEERDITLPMRGSRNQRIINLKTGEIQND